MILISMRELCFCTFSKNCFVFFLFALFLSKPHVLFFCVGGNGKLRKFRLDIGCIFYSNLQYSCYISKFKLHIIKKEK